MKDENLTRPSSLQGILPKSLEEVRGGYKIAGAHAIFNVPPNLIRKLPITG